MHAQFLSTAQQGDAHSCHCVVPGGRPSCFMMGEPPFVLEVNVLNDWELVVNRGGTHPNCPGKPRPPGKGQSGEAAVRTRIPTHREVFSKDDGVSVGFLTQSYASSREKSILVSEWESPRERKPPYSGRRGSGKGG